MLSGAELEALLVEMLTDVVGGRPDYWRGILGPLTLHETDDDSQCNWSFDPGGTVDEQQVVESIAGVLRLQHPQVGEPEQGRLI